MASIPLCYSDTEHSQRNGIQIAIVVHPDISLNNLTRGVLRAIYSKRLRQWPDGTRVQVHALPDNRPVHDRFCKKQLNIFPHQMRKIWDRIVYSGTGQAPIQVDSEIEMLTTISSTPGAIGYVSSNLVNKTVKAIDVE